MSWNESEVLRARRPSEYEMINNAKRFTLEAAIILFAGNIPPRGLYHLMDRDNN